MLHSWPRADNQAALREARYVSEAAMLDDLTSEAGLDADSRSEIAEIGAGLVRDLRLYGRVGWMDALLAEFGLSAPAGRALMELAEALGRVPDPVTQDALIADKIGRTHWRPHMGAADPRARALAALLGLGGWCLDPEADGTLRRGIGRLTVPLARAGARLSMRAMAGHFVLGRTIDDALRRAARGPRGVGYSFDMLGEAAMTEAEARRYHLSYAKAITALADSPPGNMTPSISVKLSALHCRFEERQSNAARAVLIPRVLSLAELARAGGVDLTLDAEEQDRLELTLDIASAVMSAPALRDWDGFGLVIQAYGPRARAAITWAAEEAARNRRRLNIRLVKGAYWDTEIKAAQVAGLPGYPVFTTKPMTDIAYLAAARRLLTHSDRLAPQFATHNAHTMAAILKMSCDPKGFEFQRLHGMGAALHARVSRIYGTTHRIYAPVGPHRDLLAYLVRRLLENGANSSFVHQIANPEVSPEAAAADPVTRAQAEGPSTLPHPRDIFGPARRNSKGWNLNDRHELEDLDRLRAPHRKAIWASLPMIAAPVRGGESVAVINPSDPADRVGEAQSAALPDIEAAIRAASCWDVPVEARAAILKRAADLFETHAGELMAIAAREAGKTVMDCVGELREAVDFLRYYAAEAERLPLDPPTGIIAAISPWNFPLAIFTGQIAAALAAGDAVLAKPAEATPLIAARAVSLLHSAGVPDTALQLLPGTGATVGNALVADLRIGGVVFTGSTTTAQHIHRTLAGQGNPRATLIAETGGLNAMIVDSTALPEQVVRDVLASAFQSAGQRCSALRILYLQEDIADQVLAMLAGAMDALALGDPWMAATDIGPVIDGAAAARFQSYVEAARSEGRLIKQLPTPAKGSFVGPAILSVRGIADMAEEIFGPILHVARFRAQNLDRVIEAINARGYGLTFGVHTRIASRARAMAARLRVGNIYVNRNQIGAVVGSQPFGGEGLSGTGPKAGGPDYLQRFTRQPLASRRPDEGAFASVEDIQRALDCAITPEPVAGEDLPGPTGETNVLRRVSRPPFLCLGPGGAHAKAQVSAIRAAGGQGLAVAPGAETDGCLDPRDIPKLSGFAGIVYDGPDECARQLRRALADRTGAILPLLTTAEAPLLACVERHVCTDTTASGGNVDLLSASG